MWIFKEHTHNVGQRHYDADNIAINDLIMINFIRHSSSLSWYFNQHVVKKTSIFRAASNNVSYASKTRCLKSMLTLDISY